MDMFRTSKNGVAIIPGFAVTSRYGYDICICPVSLMFTISSSLLEKDRYFYMQNLMLHIMNLRYSMRISRMHVFCHFLLPIIIKLAKLKSAHSFKSGN